jgi:hypothetical protein
MEFPFNEHARPKPNPPAKDFFTSKLIYCCINSSDAFIDFRVISWFYSNEGGGAMGYYAVAESIHSLTNADGNTVHFKLSR